MRLSEVLKLFDSSLSQEQCWSIAYGICKTLLIKKYEDHQRKERIRYVQPSNTINIFHIFRLNINLMTKH